MNKKNQYPVLKVFWGFLLSPVIGSVITGILMASMLIAEKGLFIEGNIFSRTAGVLAIPLLFAIFGELLFFVPALLLSLLCISRKFYREWKSFTYVALAGGFGAFLWMEIMVRYFFKPASVASSMQILEGGAVVLLLGALTSVFTGFLVFPAKALNVEIMGKNENDL